MWSIGPLGFAAPWVLTGLAAVPLLWLLLRAVPPAPVLRRFPAVALLLGLEDDERLSARTPWWLLALRMLALVLLVLSFAGPVWRPAPDAPGQGRGPLLIAMDGGWASAGDWPARRALLRDVLGGVAAARPVALLQLAAADGPPLFAPAASVLPRLEGLEPVPWRAMPVAWAAAQEADFDTIWISDGLAHPQRADLLAALSERGRVEVIEPPRDLLALRRAALDEAGLTLRAERPFGGPARSVAVQAIGPDPAGVTRVLGHAEIPFDAGARAAEARLDLPLELRNRVRRIQITGQEHGGAVLLAGDRLQRRKIGLVAGRAGQEGLSLLDPLHYVRAALAPEAALLEGTLLDLLQAAPDLLVLADVSGFAGLEQSRLAAWIEAGGVLIRFAGPAMAQDGAGDPFLPVRLRQGGRHLGGAMSWGAPRPLAPFAADGPFAGLALPDDVAVERQVLAEPAADLAAHVIARLADGTPLVTRQTRGAGQIILFHVTANAGWSNLPLSGLFVQMLGRLTRLSGEAASAPEPGQTWRLDAALDGFGQLGEAPVQGPVPSAALAGPVRADLRPGLYAGPSGRWPLNMLDGAPALAPADWPAGQPRRSGLSHGAQSLTGPLLGLAVLLLCLDLPLSLALSGRLAALLVALLLAAPPGAQAQRSAEEQAIIASRDTSFAYVLAEDRRVNEISAAGLLGLGQALARRTTIQTGPPQPVDPETDELAFFSLLYWPVTAQSPLPSPAALARLRAYLDGGGVILFDTRDGDLAALGGTSPEAARLRALAAPLRLPPLEPLPGDHVLTRSFYLLDRAPGRYDGPLWIEASPELPGQSDRPFAPGNDGVSPVLIGGNDWAAAWAVDPGGERLLPVGRGAAGERQREMAFRFGINLAMYALTGNYKSDQVHIPALLDRLGEGDE